MAHGQDVANLGRIRGVTAATRWVVDRSVSGDRQLPLARGPADGQDPGGRSEDRGRRPAASTCDAFSPRPADEARQQLGWEGDGPAFLCVGSLIERKNVVRLADAFAAFGRGRLAFVGDGPLRPSLEGRPGVTLAGRVPQSEVPRWIAACDVLCQPSLIEPFGQATLEAMAMERTVLATSVGGPPEFVTPEAGVLIDPQDPAALPHALELAASKPHAEPGGPAGGGRARREASGSAHGRGPGARGFAIRSRPQAAALHNRSGLRPSLMMRRPGGR